MRFTTERVVNPADERLHHLKVWHAMEGFDHVDGLDNEGKLVGVVFIRCCPGACADDVTGTREIFFTKRPTFALLSRERNRDA